jgi:hypothetical protein
MGLLNCVNVYNSYERLSSRVTDLHAGHSWVVENVFPSVAEALVPL